MATINIPQSSTVAKFVGTTLHISDFKMITSVIQHGLTAFDPSAAIVQPGQLSIVTPNIAQEQSFDTYAAYVANKPIDILMYLSLTDSLRSAIVSVTVASSVPTGPLIDKMVNEKQNIVSAFVMNYLLHGTAKQFSHPTPKVAKFLLDATRLKASDFMLKKISNMKSMDAYRSTSLVVHAIDILKRGSGTLRSRAMKGFGGNRVFTIVKAMKPILLKDSKLPAVIAFFTANIHERQAPYVTFHPDHPLNPMKECARLLYATLGSVYKSNGGNLQALAASSPNVFIDGVIDRLSANKNLIGGSLPSLSNLAAATAPVYSVLVQLSNYTPSN